MRPLIFGSPEDARFQAVKAELEAQGLRPVFRNPAFFKVNEVEKADLVVVGAEAIFAADIKAAFEALQAEVRVLEAPPEPEGLTIQVTVETPEVKAALEEASALIKSLEEALAAKDARIAELEAALAGKPVDLDSMKASELIDYAAKNDLDIGGLVPQAGQVRILAAVKEAIAKKEA
ncbi:hypothetical protein [Mesoterricola sediminis]|uniref:Uncharacterized protein n=1 Tax=Mesoterricola sediminis TaxID=2927980 RepID=A0AA48KBV7_9BACT|nr:hypothetical protein [Mesoterricola sediminis]BDU76296.1 hypothetical protein METESE_12540 [Mesoterricola sediminis]